MKYEAPELIVKDLTTPAVLSGSTTDPIVDSDINTEGQ